MAPKGSQNELFGAILSVPGSIHNDGTKNLKITSWCIFLLWLGKLSHMYQTLEPYNLDHGTLGIVFILRPINIRTSVEPLFMSEKLLIKVVNPPYILPYF